MVPNGAASVESTKSFLDVPRLPHRPVHDEFALPMSTHTGMTSDYSIHQRDVGGSDRTCILVSV